MVCGSRQPVSRIVLRASTRTIFQAILLVIVLFNSRFNTWFSEERRYNQTLNFASNSQSMIRPAVNARFIDWKVRKDMGAYDSGKTSSNCQQSSAADPNNLLHPVTQGPKDLFSYPHLNHPIALSNLTVYRQHWKRTSLWKGVFLYHFRIIPPIKRAARTKISQAKPQKLPSLCLNS
jgi:hypothetical protein